jgi:probable rRNA maturation factor
MAHARASGRRGLKVTVTGRGGRLPRARGLARWLQEIAPARARGEVVVALVSDRAIRRLNRAFAGDDRVTDVLSFPAAPRAQLDPRTRAPRVAAAAVVARDHLGDIVIASGRAARQARVAGHGLGTELRVLALHGLLHLLGYDHHADAGRMARLERRLRRQGGLHEGLIERASS